MDNFNYMVLAAERSRFSSSHWFRYLRKVIFEDYTYLTEGDVQRLWESDRLTHFQKISLKCAVQFGSPTHEFVVSLGKPAKLHQVQKLLKEYGHG